MTENTGDLGLPTGEFGTVVQALAGCVVDREEHTQEEVIAALRAWGDEMAFWDQVGPLVDELEYLLFPVAD